MLAWHHMPRMLVQCSACGSYLHPQSPAAVPAPPSWAHSPPPRQRQHRCRASPAWAQPRQRPHAWSHAQGRARRAAVAAAVAAAGARGGSHAGPMPHPEPLLEAPHVAPEQRCCAAHGAGHQEALRLLLPHAGQPRRPLARPTRRGAQAAALLPLQLPPRQPAAAVLAAAPRLLWSARGQPAALPAGRRLRARQRARPQAGPPRPPPARASPFLAGAGSP